MRLFLDANVLFTAAHNPSGKAALLIELEQHTWAVFSSPFAFEEARRNLERKCPHRLDRLTALAHHMRFVEHRPTQPVPHGLPDKDQPIFQAAVACKATHLLTGDLKHFGHLMDVPDETFGIRVQTVSQFLESLS